MDGRDIGTVILPKANLKIFLVCAPEIRAKRRFAQNQAFQIFDSYQKVLNNIIQRDNNDLNRVLAPLQKAPDAIEIDSSFLTAAQVSQKIIILAQERGITNDK